jgi:nucleoside-triphosphatase THEP1
VSWALVVAARGGKRSRAAREVASALSARGLRVGGFTQRTLDHEDGSKEFELVRAAGGASIPLARAEKRAAIAEGGGCSVVFDPAAFEAARRWIDGDAPASDVLVLDGIGKLELAGEGHRAALTGALAAAPLVVLAIRDDQLVYAVEALGLDEPVATYTDGDGPGALAAFVDGVAAAVGHAGR